MLFAAVVIPIVRHDDPTIVFVRRAAHLRRNPGQIGFPGGLIDPDDADERAAALREFEEELGIPRERLHVVDRLDDVITLSLSVTVTPYLALLDPPFDHVHHPDETESVHEVPLRSLYAPGALHYGNEAIVREGRHYDVPSWLFDDGPVHVWGATGRILHDLLTRYPSPDALAVHFLEP
jgi:8-oxo-dGTP pyrophosphatase MutT (NUDIX family)